MIKCKYIQTMDFTFKDCIITNCQSIAEIENKISESKIIEIEYCGIMYYINASYIMYFRLEDIK